tara:strand:+ start:956 stop:2035 length:1080 start_codon:yes stop_codon:yes gene_type:complete
MMLPTCMRFGLNVHIMDGDASAPAGAFCGHFVQGDPFSAEAVFQFGQNLDCVTLEIEHVSLDGLKQLEASGVDVYPKPDLLEIVQDKGLQKQFYQKHGFPTSPFKLVDGRYDITPERFRLPVVQKSRKDGYDGRGVQLIDGVDDLANAFDVPSVVEEKVDIAQEISVIVARSPSGAVRTFPTVEMVVSNVSNMLDYLLSPARLAPSIERQCIEVAESLATALDLVGLLAVELFVSQDGQVLINEIAPRPHNSGHHSIEANVTSQFEQHVRAVCDMPLGDTALKSPAVMVNLVGAEGYQGPVRYEGFNRVLAMPDVYIHLYGKAETRPFRKMGHVTIVRPNVSEAIEIAQQIKEEMQVIA